MATAEDLRALEALCPWERTGFRAGLAALSSSTAAAARAFAADARVLAGLAACVPRCPGDQCGAWPWTSLRQEVALAPQIDEDLADRAARLAPWRIRDLVRRTALVLDSDSAALRTAVRTAGRRVSLHRDSDDQASVQLSGPAVPLIRWYGTLDTRARALRHAGDPRTLDALRSPPTSTPPATTPPATRPAATTSTPVRRRDCGCPGWRRRRSTAGAAGR